MSFVPELAAGGYGTHVLKKLAIHWQTTGVFACRFSGGPPLFPHILYGISQITAHFRKIPHVVK